ncbi:MAG: putative endoribonuclease Dicer [Streblomastix strix]|uniref:Putative endoribonuclease Dicer n=1 Tax=Streblomastix strix TaxID=222440 RepID=A0A5J4WX82_9EUKA|nr:MAG: putative endoribonuclease Dicer [Streblomastix strix]
MIPIKEATEFEKTKQRNVSLRSYQTEMVEIATKNNSICFLQTGSGKTLVAVYVIKHIIENSDQKIRKKVVFLAPQVLIALQQFEVISATLPYKSGVYYGDDSINEWDAQHWKTEIEERDILIFVSEVFLHVVSHIYLTLDSISLIVFDECHHCQKDDIYARIMKTFYHGGVQTQIFSNKPRILGLTASPCMQAGKQKNQIKFIEDLFDSQLITPTKNVKLL